MTFRVTDGTEYKSFAVDPIGTVYDENGSRGLMGADKNNSAYDKTIKVYGVLDDGSKVALAEGTDFSVTSPNSAVQNDADDNGVLNVATSPVTYATDATTAVVPITVTINANGQQFTQDITFSKVASKVASVKIVNDTTTSVADAAAVSTVAANIETDFNIADLTVGTPTADNVVVTDQYGVSLLATTAKGNIVFPDGTAVVAPNVTITPVTGTITITNNGATNAQVTGSSIQAGEAFNVTLSYAGGQSASVKVIAQ